MLSYKKAIEYVAINEEPNDLMINTVEENTLTLFLSHLYEKAPSKVATDIITYRIKELDRRFLLQIS
jgi:hypothetical protein